MLCFVLLVIDFVVTFFVGGWGGGKGGGRGKDCFQINQTDCRTDTTAKGLFIWANISTSTTSLPQGPAENSDPVTLALKKTSCTS